MFKVFHSGICDHEEAGAVDTQMTLLLGEALCHKELSEHYLEVIIKKYAFSNIKSMRIVSFELQFITDISDLLQCYNHALTVISRFLFENNRLDGVFFLFGSHLTAVILSGDDDPMSKIYSGCSLISDIFQYPGHDVKIQAAISNLIHDAAETETAMRHVKDAFDFSRYTAQCPPIIVTMEDEHYGGQIDNPNVSNLAYYKNLAERISGAIDACNPDSFQSLTNECANVLLNSIPSVSSVHFQVINFCNMLEVILTENQMIDTGYFRKFPIIPSLLEAKNEGEFRVALNNSLQEIFAYAFYRKKSKYAQLMECISSYIEENISSPDLSISSISEHFQISSSNLSVQFKTYYGISIVNAIHEKRIEKIKIGLATTDKSIRQLAMENGYISITTMNRAFLKYEGVSPRFYKAGITKQAMDSLTDDTICPKTEEE